VSARRHATLCGPSAIVAEPNQATPRVRPRRILDPFGKELPGLAKFSLRQMPMECCQTQLVNNIRGAQTGSRGAWLGLEMATLIATMHSEGCCLGDHHDRIFHDRRADGADSSLLYRARSTGVSQ
jgi:hypothetical protein